MNQEQTTPEWEKAFEGLFYMHEPEAQVLCGIFKSFIRSLLKSEHEKWEKLQPTYHRSLCCLAEAKKMKHMDGSEPWVCSKCCADCEIENAYILGDLLRLQAVTKDEARTALLARIREETEKIKLKGNPMYRDYDTSSLEGEVLQERMYEIGFNAACSGISKIITH